MKVALSCTDKFALLPRLLIIYLVQATSVKLDRHASEMKFNLQIKNE